MLGADPGCHFQDVNVLQNTHTYTHTNEAPIKEDPADAGSGQLPPPPPGYSEVGALGGYCSGLWSGDGLVSVGQALDYTAVLWAPLCSAEVQSQDCIPNSCVFGTAFLFSHNLITELLISPV